MIRLALIGCRDGATRYRDAGFTSTADVDRAERAAVALGASTAAAALDDQASRHSGAFDAVLIDSPNKTHGALVQAAAVAGKHVLVHLYCDVALPSGRPGTGGR